MQNYVDAKMRIIQNQTEKDAFIYWNDDPIIKRELEKYDIKAVCYPFSELKEKGSIGYIEEGEYKIETPMPFNMEQEEMSLTGKHNIYNSLAAGIASDISGIKKEVIRKSLSDFPGCVIVVSHDRYFMDKVVDHLLVFKGNGEIQDFPGNSSNRSSRMLSSVALR